MQFISIQNNGKYLLAPLHVLRNWPFQLAPIEISEFLLKRKACIDMCKPIWSSEWYRHKEKGSKYLIPIGFFSNFHSLELMLKKAYLFYLFLPDLPRLRVLSQLYYRKTNRITNNGYSLKLN